MKNKKYTHAINLIDFEFIGIYFADVATKSANYCRAQTTKEIALMLMCEVQLGAMQNLNASTNVTNIPNTTYQSVKGNGQFTTNKLIEIDGLKAFGGKPSRKRIATGLLYNEYIVYHPAQVNIKYLFKMQFN